MSSILAYAVSMIVGGCIQQTPRPVPKSVVGDPTSIDISSSPTYELPKGGRLGPGVPPFWVRPGFALEVVADNLEEARFMQFDDRGNLYLSRPNHGDILILKKQGDRYVNSGTFVTGYRSVHGLNWAAGWLWFTTSGAVYKARTGSANPTVQTVLEGLPSGGHWWRSILVTPDSFYTSIGDSGNITDLTKTDREKIWKYSLDGKTRTLFVSGIRNTEKLLLQPGTQEIYGCDHGSDDFGKTLGEVQGKNQPVTDWNPPCEFNHYVAGGFYGHPFVVGNQVPRYEYMNRPDILELVSRSIPPAWSFGPHWAPNGWSFVSGSELGEDLKGDALVALHGSWNRVQKAGYRIERVCFDKTLQQPFGGQLLVSTLDADQKVVGRPVDVVEEPNGGVLFSDDYTNQIYRISRIK